MSNQILLFQASEVDIPAIESLLQELLDSMEDKEGFDLEQSVENYRILVNNPANYILIAREEGVAVGFLNFTTRKTVMHPGLSGLIDELIVSAKRRGLGIGRKLVLAAVEKCQELGCCEVEVSTEKTNLNARCFYKNMGFKENAVLLELELD